MIVDNCHIDAGPGMTESRTIFDSMGLLDRPWGVEPTNQSVFAIGLIYSSDTVYHTTLSGDGAISLIADASGIQLGGVNLAIVGNDISNVPTGVAVETTYDNPFDLVADNSLHGVGAGIGADTRSMTAAPLSTTVGNVFRGNTINGPGAVIPYGPVLVAAGISIGGSNNSDLGAGLMNVIDQNTVSNFRIGVQLVFDGVSANYRGSAGILDTVIANSFFSSDGNSNTFGLTTAYQVDLSGGVANLDDFPIYLFGTDQWQNFWNPSSTNPG